MSATLTRTRATRPSETGDLRLAPRAKQKRRPLLALSSALLVAVCVAVFVTLYLRAGHQVSILAISRPVPEGDTLTAGDLSTVRMSLAPGVTGVPATGASDVVGHKAAVPLEPGSLLIPSDVAQRSGIPSGDAIVGVALKQGQLPATGVSPGQKVDVVMTGAPGSPFAASATTGPAPIGDPGTVLAPSVLVNAIAEASASSGSDTDVVSLVVPRILAPLIAAASAAEQAALVVVSPGP